MASEQEITSDSFDTSAVDVPEDLLGYIKSSIIDYISKAAPGEFSAKIHYAEGQSPKLEVSFGGVHQRKQAPSRLADTKTIIVKNVPASADEELLEVFFESTKKQGGGPVQSVKILGDKHIAFVEFCECSAVEIVLKKRPIKLGKSELIVEPFKTLIHGSEKIKHVRVDLSDLADRFTEEFLKKQLECLDPYRLVPEYGPALAAAIKVGSRVVRGRDWVDGDLDGGPGGQGTVTEINKNHTVNVRWDHNVKVTKWYMLGMHGQYTIKLAP